MPFSWFHPNVPTEYTDAGQKAERMYIHELRERAALLMRLGYTKDEARARLKGNVQWDFELHGKPGHLGRIDEVVESVYKARGFGGGGPPSLEL